MERIGIYGGSFNPPHIGHVLAARYALDALCLDALLMMPASAAPHKQIETATPQQRLEMLERAIAGEEKMQVSDLEMRRGGVSYTYETLQQLKPLYPDAELILCMGTDMFLCVDHWKESGSIFANASLAVFCRGQRGENQEIAKKKMELEALGAKVYLLDNPVIQISSTDLRRMVTFACANPFLPEGVGDYIRQNRLYGAGCDYKALPMDELEKVVISLLKPNRVPHVLGCRDTAVELAKIWGANEEDAARAGLLHDITKALDGPLQLTLCREYGIVINAFSQKNPKTLHALTGSLVAERIFGENPAVVSAICSHTTGKADMNTLEKIIYVADYMEPNRDFPGVEELRSLAYTNIDKALKLGLEMTLSMLKEQGRDISSESREALAFLRQSGV